MISAIRCSGLRDKDGPPSISARSRAGGYLGVRRSTRRPNISSRSSFRPMKRSKSALPSNVTRTLTSLPSRSSPRAIEPNTASDWTGTSGAGRGPRRSGGRGFPGGSWRRLLRRRFRSCPRWRLSAGKPTYLLAGSLDHFPADREYVFNRDRLPQPRLDLADQRFLAGFDLVLGLEEARCFFVRWLSRSVFLGLDLELGLEVRGKPGILARPA